MRVSRSSRPTGSRGDDPAGHAALGREGLDQAPELEALPDRLADPVEDLGRVAARLTLQGSDQGDLLEIGVLHPPTTTPNASSSGTPSCSSAMMRRNSALDGAGQSSTTTRESSDEAVSGP